MGTNDISRSMFDPRKHYTGKWTLQGRLITDGDENDRESIGAEERRRALLDIIGAYGSPDDGWRIDNVRDVGGTLDFDILAGSLYLGGLRLEHEVTQTYRTQRDHLEAEAIAAATDNQPNRRDLVLLEAYEAPVTAVEDGELLDPAIGVDTSARSRRFQRVHVIADVDARNCDQAWQLMLDILAGTNGGTIGVDCRQVVDTRLSVTYTEEGIDDDLCEPPLVGGYLGAENQAIRVQLVADDRLTWGFDNAAPLYRVQLSADRTVVTLITPPRDAWNTPIVGQVVELLPWGAVLSNGEKTAALSGHLTRIVAVDPSDPAAGGAMTVTLADAVPTNGFTAWEARPDADQLRGDAPFVFMHIWNRGGDITSAPGIPFTVGTPLTLGTTGIQITITGGDTVRDDYWVISARPETPTRVLPWELEDGALPLGVRRYVAPLALLRWNADGTVAVTDCRPPFRPLTAMGGCCSFSVGDGKTSDGDYNDLNQALLRLGADGGEICLLPGIHRADVRLIERANITIRGCGSRSKLIPSKEQSAAIIELRDCTNIGLFNFEIIAAGGTGVAARRVDGLHIDDMHMLAYRNGIDADDGADTAIRRCVIRMLDKAGGDVGIYAQGDAIRIEECDIQIVPGGFLPPFPDDQDDDTPPVDPSDPCVDVEDFYLNLTYLVFYVGLVWRLSSLFLAPRNPYQTLGGVQIGSGSEDVVVRDNTIIGGAGNGVTLGSDIGDIEIEAMPPDDLPEVEPVRISHEFDLVRGKLLVDDTTIGGMTIIFDDGTGGTYSIPVDAAGSFSGKMPPGEYTVAVSDPAYVVVSVEPLGEGAYYVFLRERPIPPDQPGGDDLLAFIYRASIEANHIANMGFSGIGAPRYVASDEAIGELRAVMKGRTNLLLMLQVYMLTGTITGFVVDLTIYRNRITRCLQNAPLADSDAFAVERALGGISLALCDGVTIEENIVEDCGSGAQTPVCGIFISFSIDVTIRENHVLNNGQDRRAERAIGDFVRNAGQDTLVADVSPSVGRVGNANPRYAADYNRYRVGTAAGAFTTNIPTIEFGRGPRAGILLPICMSTNIFAGGAAKESSGDFNTQGLTGVATGRHAARIDGNYVVQPFGKSLFVGAAGSLSLTDNQLVSDQALPRELDALAGGISGRLAANFVLGEVDMFASNVMVVDICPGAYLVDMLAAQGIGSTKAGTSATAIPFGFADGNVLFMGNQIKQGNAGARPTVVTIFSMDDVSFADNQIDVLNATNIRTTCVVLGVTARTSNNRMKEPIIIPRGGVDGAANPSLRFSLLEIGLGMGAMINNQGHYCFKLFSPSPQAVAFANMSLLPHLLACDEKMVEPLPGTVAEVMLALMRASAVFAHSLSGM